MAQQPEGWYTNPSGPGLRWWNGTNWTEHVDPPLGPPVQQQPTYGVAAGYGQPAALPGQYPTPYGYVGTPPRFGVPFAGFWQRVGAAIIDGLVVGIPLLIIGAVLFWQDISDAIDQVIADPEAELVFSDGTVARFVGYVIVAALCNAAYFVMLIAIRGATLGMSALRIHVVDADGAIPSLGRSLGRWAFTQAFSLLTSFVPFVGGFVGLLDPLWMLWDPENQTLHDKVAKTWVLQRQY